MVPPYVELRSQDTGVGEDSPARCLEGRDCPPSLSQETAAECDLDLRPPLQRSTETHTGQSQDGFILLK